MNKSSQPIGVFDSGVGGLTVAHAISKLLPHENMIYFGDTAHLPYGDKSAEAVANYSEKITQFLIKQKCKAVVIACNTASAAAYEILKEKYGNKIILVNVIDPMVAHVSKLYSANKIGIIATKGTVASKVYETKLHNNAVKHVKSLATPLLVHLIEEGFSKHQGSKLLVNEYLNSPVLQKINVLILACTHYPIIKNIIESFYDNEVKVLDSTVITADYVKEVLSKNNLLNPKTIKGTYQFYVSDYTPAFETVTKIFWGSKINLNTKNIWV